MTLGFGRRFRIQSDTLTLKNVEEMLGGGVQERAGTPPLRARALTAPRGRQATTRRWERPLRRPTCSSCAPPAARRLPPAARARGIVPRTHREKDSFEDKEQRLREMQSGVVAQQRVSAAAVGAQVRRFFQGPSAIDRRLALGLLPGEARLGTDGRGGVTWPAERAETRGLSGPPADEALRRAERKIRFMITSWQDPMMVPMMVNDNELAGPDDGTHDGSGAPLRLRQASQHGGPRLPRAPSQSPRTPRAAAPSASRS